MQIDYNSKSKLLDKFIIDDLRLTFSKYLSYNDQMNFDIIINALKDGCLVVKINENSIFTNLGDYVILTGVSNDGKIFVSNLNEYVYNSGNLNDNYSNLFD